MLLSWRVANSKDWPMVQRHLENAGLPVLGAREHVDQFTLALSGRRLVGTAGLEVYGDAALLRSVAVNRTSRSQGIGAELVRHSLELAARLGAREVLLLTETAEDYFPRFGFKPIPRDAVPEALRASLEFRGACPDSATAMHRRLEPHRL